MNRIFKGLTTFFILVLLVSYQTDSRAAKEELIQLAILLDTSSSMDGLIDQAKSQLWKIVNEFALAKKNGKAPKLEVALYEYGKDTIPSQEGYLRLISPLTTDLDKISEELFALKTNGGSEYCGLVINSAVDSLQWSRSNRDLKLIFIAGNEPFTQGKVNYEKAVKKAIAKGIIVNTIFCGDYKRGIQTKWKHGAELADGKYINIDQNQAIVQIDAPQDEEIVRLGEELNKTYIGYGSSGKKMKARQEMQDKNAASMNKGAFIQRSAAKASVHYRNSKWDLVDAVKDKEVDVDEMSKDDLPDNMKRMNKRERKAYIAKMSKRRKGLQKKINKLNMERRVYVAKEKKKLSGKETLDSAIIKAVREQAVKKNFRFK